MKLKFREIEPFVKHPNPAARVILVYGPDAGLIKERAEIMGKTIAPDLNDPFNRKLYLYIVWSNNRKELKKIKNRNSPVYLLDIVPDDSR